MDDLCLGAPPDRAKYVFLLPNIPVLPSCINRDYFENPNVTELVKLNGNHWRKIFTIMAKLTSADYDAWRLHRDNSLFNETAMIFSTDQMATYNGCLFIVGKTFHEHFPVKGVPVCDRGEPLAYVSLPHVWCPYLDYRQFPNRLIEALRARILE